MWISEQWPMHCRGTSSRHSGQSVSNQNFTGDGEEFTTVYRNRRRSQKLFIRTTYQNLANMWRIIMESSNNHTSSITEQAELQSGLYVGFDRMLVPSARQFLENINCADQAQCERIHLCSDLKMKNRLHQECYARSCQEFEELKRSCIQEANTSIQQRLKEFFMQDDKESRTVSLFFYDLDILSSYEVLTFLIKLLLLRARESRAAKMECREIHETVWVCQETF